MKYKQNVDRISTIAFSIGVFMKFGKVYIFMLVVYYDRT